MPEKVLASAQNSTINYAFETRGALFLYLVLDKWKVSAVHENVVSIPFQQPEQ